jgi:hypothetical protein
MAAAHSTNAPPSAPYMLLLFGSSLVSSLQLGRQNKWPWRRVATFRGGRPGSHRIPQAQLHLTVTGSAADPATYPASAYD